MGWLSEAHVVIFLGIELWSQYLHSLWYGMFVSCKQGRKKRKKEGESVSQVASCEPLIQDRHSLVGLGGTVTWGSPGKLVFSLSRAWFNHYIWSNHLRLCSWPASSSHLPSVIRSHLPWQRADGTQLYLLWGPFSIRGHSPTSLPTPACPGPRSHAPPPHMPTHVRLPYPPSTGLKPARCWCVMVCAATGNPIVLEELPRELG